MKQSHLFQQVEVNILTGETTILRTDIIYDCGKSLNPAVDLGQVKTLETTYSYVCMFLFLVLGFDLLFHGKFAD